MEKQPLFRCSKLAALMTEPKTKAAKEAGELSETAKTFVEEMWLRDTYGFNEPVMTDEMMKGLICEQDAVALAQKVLGGEFRIKNTEHFRNEYICGTPDIILKQSDYVEDMKTSWNLKTFFNAELEKAYYWQAIGYMALTGKRKYRLIYCLVNTPGEIVSELIKRVWFKFGCDDTNETYNQMADQIERNHKFDDIPTEKRIKVFEFDFSQDDYDKLICHIEKARIYYNSLSL